jgi:hypothetical protein
MKSLVKQVQNILQNKTRKVVVIGNSSKSLAQRYQVLLDKGLATRRESQMPTISQKLELVDISQMSYNRG